MDGLNLEILEDILLRCSPKDVAQFAQTCKAAYQLVCKPVDSSLWRRLYCANWDDPRIQSPASVIDWKSTAQTLTRAETRIRAGTATNDDLEALLDLLSSSTPHSSSDLDEDPSLNTTFIASLLDDATIREHLLCKNRFHTIAAAAKIRRAASLSEDTPLISAPVPYLLKSPASCKLSTHYGLNISNEISSFERGAARARVYDLSRYRRKNAYGPFKVVTKPEDESHLAVDWQQMEAIMLVVGSNAMDLFGKHQVGKLFPMGLRFARPFTAPPSKSKRDWAGVEGHYHRIVCFLDYRDLFNYNIRRMNGQQGMSLDDYEEAVKLLHLELKVTSYGSEDDDSDTAFPTINFQGSSDGGNPHESTVQGTVKKMPCGNIQWRMTSKYAGIDRWSSVGVQVGGQQSASGIYGIWTGVDHQLEDPAGPYLLWRCDDPHEHDSAVESGSSDSDSD